MASGPVFDPFFDPLVFGIAWYLLCPMRPGTNRHTAWCAIGAVANVVFFAAMHGSSESAVVLKLTVLALAMRTCDSVDSALERMPV